MYECMMKVRLKSLWSVLRVHGVLFTLVNDCIGASDLIIFRPI